MNLIASNKYTLVLGLGITGLSVVRYLLAKGIRVIACDTRNSPPNIVAITTEFPGLALKLGSIDEELLCNASEIIISPGISRKEVFIQKALAAGVSVIGDIELFARVVEAPVIAITGSNGKSTVTTLVGEMARAAGLNAVVAGNIGLPVLATLTPDVDLYVLELSSFQLESTQSLKPIAATILNVSADHMDRYDSLMEYARAKQRIAFGAKTVVVNKNDALTEPPFATGVKRLCFSSGKADLKEFGCENDRLTKGMQELIPTSELRLSGLHNVANAAAALALAEAANIPMEACLEALKAFSGLRHRCEFIAQINGVKFINDSKATNVGAAVAALAGLAERQPNIHIILGGDGKDADFSPLIPALRLAAKSAVTFGKDGPKLHNLIATKLPDLQQAQVTTLEAAVEFAHTRAESGDLVLLSPACASLDMFRNFEHRGDVFAQCVREIVR